MFKWFKRSQQLWPLTPAERATINGTYPPQSSTWPSTGGIPHVCETPYADSWTSTEWDARHAAHVAHDRANGFPLVPPVN